MSKKYTFVANWKMLLDFNESISYVTENFDQLIKLSRLSNNISIVLCPSFPVLYPLIKIFESTKIQFGGQNCSAHNKGAFTGQVSAQTLHDIGCRYCIIGHSEIRNYNHETHETDEFIAKKFDLLIDQNIAPIVCIGESLSDKNDNKTLITLTTQLKKILDLAKLEEHKFNGLPVFIAYEPEWCIGTGVMPDLDYLDSILTWICTETAKSAPHVNWQVLYGGSVSPENIYKFAEIDNLSGFLIGKSSTQFQEFEKIIKRMYY